MKFTSQISGVVIMAGITGFAPPANENIKKPNIIFFIADDMSRDMFNCLEEGKNSNLSPRIDQLVNEGILMQGQHVVSPVCTPSRYNCLTGRYASRAVNRDFLNKTKKSGGQSVVEWNSFITPSDVTIAEILRENGYKTGFVGKNHVIDVPGIYVPDDYFGHADDHENQKKLLSNAEKFRKSFDKSGFDYAERIYHNNPSYIGLQDLAVHNLDWITAGGLDFLEKYGEEPFFLYFATTSPHGPYEIERSWGADRRITPLGILDQPEQILSSEKEIKKRLKSAGFDYRNSDLASKGNVVWLDDALGALMDKLKEIGKYENTIIFFFNDQGQSAKGTVYQGGTENPSIIWKYGGFKAGGVSDALVSNVDFAPTIIDMCGIDISYDGFDGKSFYSVLEGNETPLRESLYFELGYARGIRKGNMKYMAIRYPEYAMNFSFEERARILKEFNGHQKMQGKKIHHTDPNLPFSHLQLIPGGGDAEQNSISQYACYHDPDQLYDLSNDPNEQKNLFYDPEYKEIANELRNELTNYLDGLPGNFADLKPVSYQHEAGLLERK